MQGLDSRVLALLGGKDQLHTANYSRFCMLDSVQQARCAADLRRGLFLS